jgi:hypothetical protein
MKVLKNDIENSEVKTPLTAALQEIERLNKLLDDAREILEAEFLSMQVEGEPAYKPTLDQVNDTKIDLLSNLLF